MSPRPAHRAIGPTRRRIPGVVAVLSVLMVALGALTLPVLDVPQEAEAAKADLEAAGSALRSGDLLAAREAVESARQHVDEAQDGIQGLGGDVWTTLPLLGTPVADARRLVQVLDDATAAAEIGIDLYPAVAGEDATLIRDRQIDEATLERVIEAARRVGTHVYSAQRALDSVEGTTPFVGDTIIARRDEAARWVSPMADTFRDLEPMLEQLPVLLGFEGRREYLIALLNPAELRYSGGAALVYAPLALDEGQIEVGETSTVASDPALRTDTSWRKVRGNDFHRDGTHVLNSTFAPSWSTSGEELLRAWRATHPEGYSAVLALDVVAMANLLGTIGGTEVPGYGVVTEDNLAQILIGSYDQYYADPYAQDLLNLQLIPVFTDLLFGEGSMVDKIGALKESADGRHFAMYFRDPEMQQAVTALGMDGDLATPEGDYVGVFTQNLNGSKADYWQRRRVTLDVTLGQDGSATNRLDVHVHNDSPRYTLPVPDERFGYFTRYAEINLAAFLPEGVAVKRASLEGERWEPRVRVFHEHSYVAAKNTMLAPSATADLSMTYTVPDAASVSDSGDLVYRLALDPQGTVNPQALDITVRIPQGYRASALPDGWAADHEVLTYSTEALESTQEWEIPLEATS